MPFKAFTTKPRGFGPSANGQHNNLVLFLMSQSANQKTQMTRAFIAGGNADSWSLINLCGNSKEENSFSLGVINICKSLVRNLVY